MVYRRVCVSLTMAVAAVKILAWQARPRQPPATAGMSCRWSRKRWTTE